MNRQPPGWARQAWQRVAKLELIDHQARIELAQDLFEECLSADNAAKEVTLSEQFKYDLCRRAHSIMYGDHASAAADATPTYPIVVAHKLDQ